MGRRGDGGRARVRVREGGAGRRLGAAAALAAAALAAAAAPAGRALAQQPPAAAPAAGGNAAALAGDLSTRYRFLERYTDGSGAAVPGEIGQYEVYTKDVIKGVIEKPQGAPERNERTVVLRYTERPAKVDSSGLVTDAVRRYDKLDISPAAPARPSAAKPLEGLSVWFHTQPGAAPLLISLDPTRRITEVEYMINLRQLFVPDLAGVLPALPRRVGDRWRIPRGAAQALYGEKPAAAGEPLAGVLKEVRPSASGRELIAVIGVTGSAVLPQSGPTLLNAEILFTFTPPAPEAAEGAGVGAGGAGAAGAGLGADAKPTGVTDAHGMITQVRLARSSTLAVPGSEGRLKLAKTWELTLWRRPAPGGTALAVPDPAPTPTEANSWLTYEDPKGLFHFRHPQEFLRQQLPTDDAEGTVELIDANAGADNGRVITMTLQPRSTDPANDPKLKPENEIKTLNEQWTKTRMDVLRGPTGWLPDRDWGPDKRVYRIEAALRPGGAEGRGLQRIYLDHYLVLFSQNASLVVDAMTGQEPPLPFRQQVEAILRTFTLGPPRVGGAAPVDAGTAPSPAPGARGAETVPASPFDLAPSPAPGGAPAPAAAPGGAPAPTGRTPAPRPGAPAPPPSTPPATPPPLPTGGPGQGL